MTINHMKGRNTKDFQLSYLEIMRILRKIDKKHSTTKKIRKMFIIGGTSLMIRELNNRQLTQDIDSFELMEDSRAYWFKPITSLTKADPTLFNIVNSDAFDITNDILTKVYDYEQVLEGMFNNIEIWIPSVNLLATMKIFSYHDSNGRRQKDMDDITFPKFKEQMDLDKVKEMVSTVINTGLGSKRTEHTMEDYEYIFKMIEES